MKKNNLVIMNGDGNFLTISKNHWSNEYHDAELFNSFAQVKKRVKSDRIAIEDLEIVQNFGFTNEQSILGYKL